MSDAGQQYPYQQAPMPQQPPYGVKPGLVTAAPILLIIGAVVNALAMFNWLLFALGTYGFGCLMAPIGIFGVVVAVFEVMLAVKMLSNPPKPTTVGFYRTVAIMEIICILNGNPVSLAAGIVILVMLNDDRSCAYLGLSRY